MSWYTEYIEKQRTGKVDYQVELLRLIKEYNKLTGNYLFVYVSASYKPNLPVALEQSDYYIIFDLLHKIKEKNLDFYIETPGGSGQTAEEIAGFLHKQFEHVSFLISGEAKSAGTILALSGHDISMTRTGSLGPIDAQIYYPRGRYSAHDYIEWLKEKRTEADKNGKLNLVDAQIISQVTPGEVKHAYNALKFAYDVVRKWLVEYKFKYWTKTETKKKVVTETIKKRRANSIANDLCNHTKWRDHGRSLKIDDLEKIGLKVNSIDDNEQISDVIYRIQTICKLLCESSSVFKIMATCDQKIFKHQINLNSIEKGEKNKGKPDSAIVEIECPKCKTKSKIEARFTENKNPVDKNGVVSFPKDNIFKCICGSMMNLASLRNDLENQTGKKII